MRAERTKTNMMSASNAVAMSGEISQSSTAEVTARLAAAGLRSCKRCLTMSPPDAEGCHFCGQLFGVATRHGLLTIALRATVIPMLFAAIGVCVWLLLKGQSPAALFVH